MNKAQFPPLPSSPPAIHFFSTMTPVKTNKIHSIAMTTFPWIAFTALLGLMTLSSEISVSNHGNQKEKTILGIAIVCLSLYLATLGFHTGTKTPTPTPTTTEPPQVDPGKDTQEGKLANFEKNLKTIRFFNDVVLEREERKMPKSSKSLTQIIGIINTMELLPDSRKDLHTTLFNCKLSIALPAFKEYFKRQRSTPNEENELINCASPYNLPCHHLKMRTEDFQYNGKFNCDPNLFLPSLLLIHFFFEKNSYVDTNRICQTRSTDWIEPRNKISDDEVSSLLKSLDYDTSELKECIKKVYEFEKTNRPFAKGIFNHNVFKDIWVSKQESFNNWIDTIITDQPQTKSATKAYVPEK